MLLRSPLTGVPSCRRWIRSTIVVPFSVAVLPRAEAITGALARDSSKRLKAYREGAISAAAIMAPRLESAPRLAVIESKGVMPPPGELKLKGMPVEVDPPRAPPAPLRAEAVELAPAWTWEKMPLTPCRSWPCWEDMPCRAFFRLFSSLVTAASCVAVLSRPGTLNSKPEAIGVARCPAPEMSGSATLHPPLDHALPVGPLPGRQAPHL